MRTGLRNKVMGGFGVACVGLMASSAAYACTTYRGYLNASGNGGGNVAQRVAGTNSGMNWCQAYTPSVKTTVGSTASLTLETGASVASDNCPALSKMAANGRFSSYKTSVTNGAGYMPQGGGSGAVHNCHGTTGTAIDTGGVVNSSGVWKSGTNGTSTIPFTATAGPQSVCIYMVGTLSGPDAIAINFDAV